jgi:putative flippase GtrA
MLIEKLIKIIFSGEFIRYVVVGVVSVGIEMALLIMFVEWMKMSYLQSNVLAFLITNILNYALSRLWVFEKTGRRKRIEFVLFAISVSISLLISQSLMYVGVEQLHLDYKLSKLISIVIVVAWNFFTRKNFVFAKRAA